MRVSSGTAKGRVLKAPNIEGIRISQEIVRGAIFAILFDKIKNAKCLDLYAGSGSVGIEALSRGASSCDFVDSENESTKTIEENLKQTKLTENSQIFTQEVIKFIGSTQKKYDIVFLDPFYNDTAYKHIFKTLPMIMEKDAVIIFLHGKNIDIANYLANTSLTSFDQRKYGATIVDFLKLNY